MNHFLRFLLLTLLLGGSLLMTACDKTTSDPGPAAGTVEGKITPANSITTVTATNDAKEKFTTTPTAAGDYSFTRLVPGEYVLSFTPAQDYSAPADLKISVKAGESAKAADVTAQKSGGSGSWTVNGAAATSATFVLGTLQFSNLTVILSNNAIGQTITFNLDRFAGAPGTFTAGGFTTSQLMFSQTSGNTANQWTASFLGGTGTITVTSVGTNPRRISGTFTGTLAPATSTATGNRTVTGTFTNIQY